MTKAPISISIPTHCRPEMLTESFAQVLDDPRIREVVVSDDCSGDGSFEKVIARWHGHEKVRVFRNKSNFDCYRNKRQAVELSTSEWCVLLDDDNVISRDYLDKLWALPPWEAGTIYCPDFAEPHFNYTQFSGCTVTRQNVAQLMVHKVPRGFSDFKTALNTCNYFIHREAYLQTWVGGVDPVTADTLFHAYNWLAAGGVLLFVPGLRYQHRIHEGSHYKKNWRRTGNFVVQVENKLKSLK
jgi:glycosyltransferase involved in cell wall biosynthesis